MNFNAFRNSFLLSLLLSCSWRFLAVSLSDALTCLSLASSLVLRKWRANRRKSKKSKSKEFFKFSLSLSRLLTLHLLHSSN